MDEFRIPEAVTQQIDLMERQFESQEADKQSCNSCGTLISTGNTFVSVTFGMVCWECSESGS